MSATTPIHWTVAGLHVRAHARDFAEKDPYEGYYALTALHMTLGRERAAPMHLQPTDLEAWADSITRRVRMILGIGGIPSKAMDLVRTVRISPAGVCDHDVHDVTEDRRWLSSKGNAARIDRTPVPSRPDLMDSFRLPINDAAFYIPNLVG